MTERTHCVNGHEYTAENTLRYRGDKGRRCRQCERARQAHRKVTYHDKARDSLVRCPSCQDPRMVTERTARRIWNGEFSGKCEDCRYGWRKPVPLVPAEDFVQWWREQNVTPREARWLWSCLSLSVPSTLEEAA